MIIRLDASDLKKMFEDWHRDYYSYEACETMLNYYNECDENMEVDIIGMCGEWTEYAKDDGCLIQDYGYLADEDELNKAETTEDKNAIIAEAIEHRTIVYELSNSYLVMAF